MSPTHFAGRLCYLATCSGERRETQPVAPATLQTGVGVPPSPSSTATLQQHAQLLAWDPADTPATRSCLTMTTALMIPRVPAVCSMALEFSPRLLDSCRTSPFPDY